MMAGSQEDILQIPHTLQLVVELDRQPVSTLYNTQILFGIM